MATALSREILALGIYLYTMMVTAEADPSATGGCVELFHTCLSRSHQFANTNRCGELKDLVNCLKMSDITNCDVLSSNHTEEETTSQANQVETFDINQSHHELHKVKSHLPSEDNSAHDVIENEQTRRLDSTNDSQSVLDGAVHGNTDSQNDEEKGPEKSNVDYLMTLFSIIGDAREEYEKQCSYSNIGTSAITITWPPKALLLSLLTTSLILSFSM